MHCRAFAAALALTLSVGRASAATGTIKEFPVPGQGYPVSITTGPDGNLCHMGSIGTEPRYNAHTPAEICTDAFQANRGPDGTYVTAPLQALFTRSKRGFHHDGRYSHRRRIAEAASRRRRRPTSP